MSRYLMMAAILVAGCEQLKSPQRLHELEEKVDKLRDDVAALKAGSGSAAKPAAAHGGEGSAVAAGTESAHPGAGSEEGKASEKGSGAEVAEGAGSAAGHGAEPAAGSGSAATEAHAAGEPPGSGSGSAGGDKADRALADLRAVVASAMHGTKPHAPPSAPAAPAELPVWSYEGAHAPPTWGTLDPAWRACLAGKAQSPVDIEPRAGTASAITFHYKPTAATVKDEGHTLRVELEPGSAIEIAGHAYQLVQFHVHTPSEHTIAGEHYPLELHLVHQDGDGKIAVIGVLYDAGAESKLLSEVWSRWPRKAGGSDKLRKPFDPSGLLPETRTVFRYPGSLTTPPCTEGVIWNVMRRAMSDSKAHLDEVARHYPHSARDVQPLGERKIE